MKNSVLKTLRILVTTCFAVLLLGASALLTAPTLMQAKAADEENILSTEYKPDGASVRVFASQRDGKGGRIFVETAKQGIRFHIEAGEGYEVETGVPLVDVTKQNAYNDSYVLAEGYKTYTLVLPEKFIDGELLPTSSKVLAIETTQNWFTDKDGNWESVAYVYDVPASMYTANLCYRGIICKVEGETETIVAKTEMQTRSLAWVAKQAYNDTIDTNSNYWGTEDLDTQAAPLIKKFVPTYTITYNDASGNKIGEEEVLWGDTPQDAPSGLATNTWYDTTNSEEVSVTDTMNWTENRTLTLTATTSDEFILTGVASHSHTNHLDGVKVFATLPKDKFSDNTELDIHAVNVTHSGNGTFTGLAGVWAIKEGDNLRLFFGFNPGTALNQDDEILISGDSVFYANGVMYKLTEDYVIEYDGIDYGVFLGYLNNAHVKSIYNAAEDASGNNGDPNDFTIRVEFYEDIMITDEFTFKHPDSTMPVYIQCGNDASIKHPISGGEYYWVEYEHTPGEYTKILELISEDENGNNLNTAYGKHQGDELHGLAGTMLVQNGGYYIFEDEMYARFLPKSTASNGVVEGTWTVGDEAGAFGASGFDKFGEYVANDNEVRFSTASKLFETTDAATLTLENMSADVENAVYYTRVDGTVTPLTEFRYHGYDEYQIFGFCGVPTPQTGDTLTIIGGTRFWLKQAYYTIGDLVGEERTKDVVFCYNGQMWCAGYDASNNVTVANADVGGIDTDGSHGGEIRLWFNGSANQILNSTLTGYMIIDERFPALYNGTPISGLNAAFYYSQANDMVSLVTGITTAKDGDHFIIPKGSTWWTAFYGGNDDVNRAVIFNETVEATFNGEANAWVKGNQQTTFDYVGGNFTVSGIEKGYLYQGHTYTFKVTPNNGYVLSKVLINNVEQPLNANNQFSFTATQERTTLQVETIIGYNVTFNVAEGVTVDGGAIQNGMVKAIASNNSLTFSVAAAEGYKIMGVSGATDNGDGTYTVSNVTANTTVTISVEKLYKVSYSGDNVTVTANVANGAWVDNGTTVTFTISAESGYTLINVVNATKVNATTYTATVNGADLNVTTNVLKNDEFVDVTDTISIENWGGLQDQEDNKWFVIKQSKLDEYMIPVAEMQPTGDSSSIYWNDHLENTAHNYGIDPMEYICIDGISARTLINQNNATNQYVGSTFPFNVGGIYAPVTLEMGKEGSAGLWMRVMTAFDTEYEITIKAGFTFACVDNIYYVSKDVTFVFNGSSLGRKVNNLTINATNASISGLESSQEIEYGKTYTFTVSLNSNCQLDSVVSDQVAITNNGNGSYSFTAGMSDVYISITAKKLYAVTWSNPTGATISVTANGNAISSGATVVEGTSISVTTTASSGYRLNTVTIGGAAQSGVSTAQAGSSTFNYTVNAATSISATTVKMYTVSWSAGDGTTVTCNTSGLSNDGWVDNGTTVSFTIIKSDDYEDLKVNGSTFAGGTYSVTVNGANVKVEATATKKSCLVEGTMIMLADGTQKAVENIVAGDKVMVFNHESGKYEAGTIWFNDHADEPASLRNVINLTFANGAKAKIAYEHAYFDLDLMKYVFIRAENMHEYVGHRFVSISYNGTEVVQSETVLVNAYITEEFVKVYGPITEYHFNLISDDMLSMPSFNFDARGMVNIFEYDENLQYNAEKMQEDIQTYGVFTYEEFSEYMSYEDYCKAPIQYFKVAIGKGNLTWEQIELTLQYLATNEFAG